MKKTLFFTVLAAFFTVSAFAQQSVRAEIIPAFRAISITGNVNVTLLPSQSDTCSIRAEVPGDINRFSWSVDNGTLHVRLRSTAGKDRKTAMTISYRELGTLVLNGAVLTAPDTLRTRQMDVNLSAGASASMTVVAEDLYLEATGNAAAALAGKVDYLTVAANMHSKIDMRDLQAESVVINAVTGAEVYVWAAYRLWAEAKSGATVFYKGEPVLLRSRTNLGGGVNNIGR